MVGTTRSRVNFFMNKFRKLGFIEYNGGLKVNSSLLTRRPPRLRTAVGDGSRPGRAPRGDVRSGSSMSTSR